MPPVTLLIDSAAILAAVPPARAVELTAAAFVRHHAGDWEMPPKTYVDAPPDGDFRAMPARGDGLATLKWVTSFPAQPGARPARRHRRAAALERRDRRAARDPRLRRDHLAAHRRRGRRLSPGPGPRGRRDCRDRRLRGQRRLGRALPRGGRLQLRRLRRRPSRARGGPRRRARLEQRQSRGRGRLRRRRHSHSGRAAGDRCRRAAPGRPRRRARRRRPRQGGGRGVASSPAAGSSAISGSRPPSGGELAGPVERGEVGREDVTDIGAVLAGAAPGRTSDEEITLFDSTGLAIQDLAIAAEALAAAREGRIEAARSSCRCSAGGRRAAGRAGGQVGRPDPGPWVGVWRRGPRVVPRLSRACGFVTGAGPIDESALTSLSHSHCGPLPSGLEQSRKPRTT